LLSCPPLDLEDRVMSLEAVPTAPVSVLQRPSGGFAMLAVDQREAMREMFQPFQAAPVSDEQVTSFKLAAVRALTPHASAVLLDRQFVLDRALDEHAVAPSCALIAAADRFSASADEIVADVEIDDDVDPAHYARRGVRALKLLILYRPDEPAATRIEMLERFVERCRSNGLVSIVEPVSRPPRTAQATTWDWDSGVLAAARELGSRGADLYKAEVPLHGSGDPDEVRRRCADISSAVSSPWVVLSSGVDADAFPTAVELACREGASGFLAGRAVWRGCIGAPNQEECLTEDAVPRLQRLVDVVDSVVAGR
jgi:sulfofructosephosphate aldolase